MDQNLGYSTLQYAKTFSQKMTPTRNLREWAPLTDLFNKLPIKSQLGIFTQDVKLTCIDVLPEFLVLGTNVGIIYWYDRKKKDLQRLQCEKPHTEVTVVKVISSVDYMVACGNKLGSINIFQVPKTHPDSIPDNLKPKKKQVERYTVSDLHKSPITAIEWSKNGMKLFSGDSNGCIVLTEIDFYMHICKSLEILNESYEVVQLSYTHLKLLVSTTYRSIICEKQEKWKVCQVGKKDRKILGRFGGIIYQSGHNPGDAVIYCTRPRLRMWISDCEGNVHKTLLFKDLLSKECLEVPIINPISRNLKMLKPQKEPSFGVILPFSDDLILTYNNDVIYILNPRDMTVLSTLSLLRNVLCVASCKNEIFILEEARNIVRIAYEPEAVYDNTTYSPEEKDSFLPIPISIKELTNKLQTSSVLPAISPFADGSPNDVNIHTDHSLVMNAEEAKESPIKTRSTNSEIEKKFSEIGKQQFNDQILFKQNIKKKKHSGMTNSTTSLSSNSSEEHDVNYVKPTLMNLSSVGVLPDLRSPESIQSDIDYKEKILAEVLNLDRVKIPLDRLQERNDEQTSENIEEPLQQWEYRKPNFASEPPSTSRLNSISNSTCKKNTQEVKEGPRGNRNEELLKIQEKPAAECTPACLNIPNNWKLEDIQLTTTNRIDNEMSDNTLADWEII